MRKPLIISTEEIKRSVDAYNNSEETQQKLNKIRLHIASFKFNLGGSNPNPYPKAT